MVAFYKHDIAAWMDGTESLSDGAYRAYHVICQLIYLNEGPITPNEHGIAGRCRQSIRAYRANLQELIDRQKLALENGRLGNSRANQELEKIGENRINAGKGGENSAKQRSSGSKPLKTNGAGQAPLQADASLIEKTREEKKDAAPMARSSDDVSEKDLFDRGKKILGPAAGGMITKLVKAKNGSYALARAALETASTKSNPREYVGAIINGTGPPDDARARGDAW